MFIWIEETRLKEDIVVGITFTQRRGLAPSTPSENQTVRAKGGVSETEALDACEQLSV